MQTQINRVIMNIWIKYVSVIFFWLFLLLNVEVSAQVRGIDYTMYGKVEGQDTIIVLILDPITIYSKKNIPRFYRNITRLKTAIIVTYPIAKDAEQCLKEMRCNISEMDDKKEIRRYVDSVENELIKRYTPKLKKMTYYQGAILLKLIDRQTGNSGYSLVKEIKNGFSAFFWQAIARIYGANLKTRYAPRGKDFILEDLVLQYEEQLRYNNRKK